MPSVAAAAGPSSPSNQTPVLMPLPAQAPAAAVAPQVLPVISEGFAKDAIIAWFRGEFAAANAIIDALCSHLAQLAGDGGGSEYEAVFAAIHQRRLNWIPILQMQKYYSIADVALELRKVAAEKDEKRRGDESRVSPEEKSRERNGGAADSDNISARDEWQGCQAAVAGSQAETISENIEVCSNHEDCAERPAQIKLTKGYIAKEPVKGRSVNVLKGLKLFEDIFNESELSKLTDFVNQLRVAGQNGELSGDTFTLFNKEMKGNRRELIQLGIPIFGQIREGEASVHQTSNIEPIPALLESLIDHLVLWNLIPDYKRPNSCIVNFFDRGEYSQPFLKPPHLDQPIITLLLSESTMAFGRTLTSVGEGNFKGPLMLSLKEGSVLVMRGNSSDLARHVMCSSGTKRISITFFIVRPDTNQDQSPVPLTGDITLWQPGVQHPYTGNGIPNQYETMNPIPKWGPLRAPLIMVPPMHLLSPKWVPNGNRGAFPKRFPNGGTGVFLPWAGGSRKSLKQLPPRAQKGRLLALPSPVETHVGESIPDPGIAV